jgi:hypothetical protein
VTVVTKTRKKKIRAVEKIGRGDNDV